MNKSEILQKLTTIIQDVLQEEVSLSETTTANDIEKWDSLNHIKIIVEIEKGFNIRFSYREVEALKNIGDIISSILSKNESN